MHNTPFIPVELAGWLIQRNGEQTRVIAGIELGGKVEVWHNGVMRITNGTHTAKVPWAVVPPGELPSKHSARQKWQEIQGSIIIEGSQE